MQNLRVIEVALKEMRRLKRKKESKVRKLKTSPEYKTVVVKGPLHSKIKRAALKRKTTVVAFLEKAIKAELKN